MVGFENHRALSNGVHVQITRIIHQFDTPSVFVSNPLSKNRNKRLQKKEKNEKDWMQLRYQIHNNVTSVVSIM